MKKLLAIALAASMMVTMSGTTAFAAGNSHENTSARSIDDILLEYHKAVMEVTDKTEIQAYGADSTSLTQIQADTVNALNEAGYLAYDVNPQTYNYVEDLLVTDFQEIGLSPEYSYIVAIKNPDEENLPISRGVPPSDLDGAYKYTYNGSTYILRELVVTALDDPAMIKTSEVDLLNSTSNTLIKNCLNTAISAYLYEINYALGTVASICGLNISMFTDSSTPTKIELNCCTDWVSEYTQVWNDSGNSWVLGSCVEYATSLAYMSGHYINTSGHFSTIPQDESSATLYSKKFNSYTWRRQQAVVGYLYSTTQYDTVNTVQYKADGKVKATHKRTF